MLALLWFAAVMWWDLGCFGVSVWHFCVLLYFVFGLGRKLLGVLWALMWFCAVMWWDLGCFLVNVWRIFVI